MGPPFIQRNAGMRPAGSGNTMKVYFGPYLIVINDNNADKGVIPLINVLRDPHYNYAEKCDEYKQVWSGDMVEFFDMLEAE